MLRQLPIVPHQCCELSGDQLEFAESVSAGLLRSHPELRIQPLFRDLVPQSITDGSSLHIDDLSEIQNADSSKDSFYQERARLRAIEGDVVATSLPPIDGYETYCHRQLGLGPVQWIQPQQNANPLLIAEACWEDRRTRRTLVRQIRSSDLRYVHPHIGSRASWELALLLSQASHRAVKVIAPPPCIANFVNDKGAFTKLAEQMFGVQATPPSAVAWNTSTTAKRLQELAATSARMIGIKLPLSAGGKGNLLIPISSIRGRDLKQLHALLEQRLPEINYEPAGELLITQWVEDVIAAPSAQLWIYPTSQGPPVLEGLFSQVIGDDCGGFSGYDFAIYPRRIQQQMTLRCLQLARVFQRLGYVGRCSFDMLIVGADMDAAEVEFVECNGRWGGTSSPMTLMNQIFGDWMTRPHSMRFLNVPGLSDVPFESMTSALGDQLYRRESDTGRFILLNPKRTRKQSDIAVISLGQTWGTASESIVDCANQLANVVVEKSAS